MTIHPKKESTSVPRWSYPTIRLACALIAVIFITGLIGRGVNGYLAGRFAKVAATSEQDPQAVYELLLAMEEEGVKALVQNASSNDPRIANKARNILFVRIDTWLSELSSRDPAELSKRLNQLLNEIEQVAPELTESGRKWSDQIAYRLLQIAPRLRVKDRGVLISAVDDLFATFERIPVRPELSIESPKELTVAQSLEAQRIKTPPQVPRELANQSEEAIASLPMATEQFRVSSPSDSSNLAIRPLPEVADNSANKPWQPNWQSEANPIEKMPKRPREIKPNGIKKLQPDFDDLDDLLPIEMAQLDDRQLLSLLLDNAEKLLAADQQAPSAVGPSNRSRFGQDPVEPTVVTLEQERLLALRQALTTRGYSTVQLDQIRLFLSNYAEDRLELVEQLMVSYSGDHSRMLLQLSNDPSPEVRLAAISVLGSSSQRVLVEAAWNKSLRDADPRVAALADGLQAQLESQF